jgi:hypothetical protein
MAGLANCGKRLNDGKNFAAAQVGMVLEGFNFRRFLENCHAENARRMLVFEPELLRPSFLPQLAGGALKALRLWSAQTEVEPNTVALPPLAGRRLPERSARLVRADQ